MLRAAVLLACLVLCHSHAVYPVYPVVPAAHSLHTAPLLLPYPLHHGYTGHGLLGHGLVAKPLAHNILKRSPHYAPSSHLAVGHVAPVAHVTPVAHVAPVAYVAPVLAPLAVSHQSRVDVHTSPAVVAGPGTVIVKSLGVPLVPAAPLLHKTGHYGHLYPHYAHTHY